MTLLKRIPKTTTDLTDWSSFESTNTSALAGKAAASHSHTLSDVSDAGSAAALDAGTSAGEVPVLDGSGKLPVGIIPAVALSEFLGAPADETAMLLLTGQPGDYCRRVDDGTIYILTDADATVAENWVSSAGGGSTTSIDGLSGGQLTSAFTSNGVTSNVSISGATITAGGTDSNVPISLVPKGTAGVAFGTGTATGSESFASGAGATASGSDSVALGSGSTADGDNSTALNGGRTYGTCGFSSMPESEANGDYSTASGAYAQANGNYATASGYNSSADGANSIASGVNSTATGDSSIASGSGSTASGTHSVASGHNSTADSYWATASGYGAQATATGATASGYLSTASGAYSTASGKNSTASAAYAIAAGRNAIADGESATALGYFATASGIYSVAMGGRGNASRHGEVAVGNGIGYQSVHCRAKGTTTTATETEIFLNGSTARFTLASNQSLSFVVTVFGQRTDAAGTYQARIVGTIQNRAGTVSFPATPTIGDIVDTSGGSYDATVEADDTNDALVIKVTGATSHTMRWIAQIDAVELSW